MASRAPARGLTIVEVLVTLAVVGVIAAGVVAGMGATTNARVRHAATMIAGAIRVAYARSSASAKPVRLVFDLNDDTLALEEGSAPMLVVAAGTDVTAGAAGETSEERDAIAQSEKVLKGPRAPRPSFKPVKTFGFQGENAMNGKSLGRGVKIKGFESDHDAEARTEGRAYLYFWPGGWTERAAIRVGRADNDEREDGLTLFVSPLTGKVRTERGQKTLEVASERGEREDSGF